MAAITDFFRSDEFSALELTQQMNKEPFLPTLMGETVFRDAQRAASAKGQGDPRRHSRNRLRSG